MNWNFHWLNSRVNETLYLVLTHCSIDHDSMKHLRHISSLPIVYCTQHVGNSQKDRYLPHLQLSLLEGRGCRCTTRFRRCLKIGVLLNNTCLTNSQALHRFIVLGWKSPSAHETTLVLLSQHQYAIVFQFICFLFSSSFLFIVTTSLPWLRMDLLILRLVSATTEHDDSQRERRTTTAWSYRFAKIPTSQVASRSSSSTEDRFYCEDY